MTPDAAVAPVLRTPDALDVFGARLADRINPIVVKELRQHLRTRTFWVFFSLMLLAWEQLQGSSDAQLAGIAARSLKEVRYHVRHSTDWLIRLGDGTDESHRRMQAAMDHLMPYTQEFWTDSPMEQAASDSGTGVRMADLRKAWEQAVHTVLAEATLKLPSTHGYVTQGKNGLHTEHLSYLLGEMQSLARAHPGATW